MEQPVKHTGEAAHDVTLETPVAPSDFSSDQPPPIPKESIPGESGLPGPSGRLSLQTLRLTYCTAKKPLVCEKR